MTMDDVDVFTDANVAQRRKKGDDGRTRGLL